MNDPWNTGFKLIGRFRKMRNDFSLEVTNIIQLLNAEQYDYEHIAREVEYVNINF